MKHFLGFPFLHGARNFDFTWWIENLRHRDIKFIAVTNHDLPCVKLAT
jgi:hypothetical protein